MRVYIIWWTKYVARGGGVFKKGYGGGNDVGKK